MLLTYPHPQGLDETVLPESGPRWPLVRLEHHGYRISNPSTGHSRYFAAPVGGVAVLERIADRNHNTITFDYDSDGTPVAKRHSGGYCLAFTVDEHRITALRLVDAAGGSSSDVVIKRYGYTGGNLSQVINSSGVPTQFSYDERLRVTSWEDTNHSRYFYAYDHKDRCVRQGGEAGHLVSDGWKMFNKKGQRVGTYDADLNYIKK